HPPRVARIGRGIRHLHRDSGAPGRARPPSPRRSTRRSGTAAPGSVVMRAVVIALAACVLIGCTDVSADAHATCVLIDVSGTYADEVPAAIQLVKLAVLPRVTTGHSLVAATIDDDSYDKRNLIAVMTADARPSVAN